MHPLPFQVMAGVPCARFIVFMGPKAELIQTRGHRPSLAPLLASLWQPRFGRCDQGGQ